MNLNVIKYKINKRLIWLLGDKTYESYSESLEDCISKGYENSAIIGIAKEKAKIHRQSIEKGITPHVENLNIFPLLSLINELARAKKVINIIDFGGADGGHYLLIRQLLNENIKLRWQVIETPEMVKGVEEFTTDELSFSDNLDDAIQKAYKVDILFTSGTIQYTPNPYQLIEKIINSGAEYLAFNRQSLNVTDTDLITVQRSLLSWHGSHLIKTVQFTDHEIRYPHTNISIKKFEDIVQQKYAILFTYEDDSGVKKVNNESIIGKSYIMKRL